MEQDLTELQEKKPTHRVFFSAGFMGFDELAGIRYFVDVDKVMREVFERHQIPVEFYFPKTAPLAGLRSRAAILSEAVAQKSWDDQFTAQDPIHLVGHSSGGIDGRLLAYCTFLNEYRFRQGKLLDGRLRPIAYAGNGYLFSLTTMASPHYGTPVAGIEERLLTRYVLSLNTIIHWGAEAIKKTSKNTLIRKLVAEILPTESTQFKGLESFFMTLLTQEEEGILRFLTILQEDQNLMQELTPKAMAEFNFSKDDETLFKHLACFSTANFADPVSFTQARELLKESPFFIIYWYFHRLAQKFQVEYPYARDYYYDEALSETITKKHNDGIVPTLSQFWGKVIKVQKADHLDILGHYQRRYRLNTDRQIKSYDLFHSGSQYREENFLALYRTIAENIISVYKKKQKA